MKNIKYNLIYHLCLTNINPILYFNLSNLKKYLVKFNGKKVINVNFDEDQDFAEKFVTEYFKDFPDIKFFFTKNSETNNWYELYPFITKLMPSVCSIDENEYTFYGHTKSVTHYNSARESVISILWPHTMYTKNLDDFEYISNILENYECCGTFKLDRPYSALSFVPWHYSGAFFWFKNKSIFSKNWQTFYADVHGLEGYLATHLKSSEAYSIEPSLPNELPNILDKYTWNHIYNI